MSKPFVNLHTHSYYSILSSPASPKSILEKSKKMGHSAVALTDSGVGYGLVEFFEEAQKLKDIMPILGAEVFIAKDSRFEHRAGIDGKEGHVVLLAKNKIGYQNLLKIISLAHLEGFYYKARADYELLAEHCEGLVVLTGSTGGVVGKALHNESLANAENVVKKLLDIFGEQNVFLELASRDFEIQKTLNLWKTELSKKLNISLVITSDARYMNAEDEEAADTLHCIGRNQDISDPSRVKFGEKNWFKSFEEISSELDYVSKEILEGARENTLKIAEDIDLVLEFGNSILPEIKVPDGETLTSQLQKDCKVGFVKKFPNPSKDEKKILEERLEYELSIIGKMGFEAYFLIVADLIQFAKNNEIAVGPGRGSAAGSIVSYLLDITTVDPIKYELLFERFLNPARISMPDIDIDFSDERRDEVLQYVTEKYGTEKVSKVCTFGTLAAKAALKDVGRAQGVPFAEMNALTKLLPNRPGFTLKDAEEIADFQTLIKTKAHLQKVFEVAKKLEGCVRHVSVHACAVMIAPDELMSHSPIQWAPGAEEIKITQFPYQQLEHLGLLKMDFLGLKNLSILEKTIANIRLTQNKDIDLQTIPIDDSRTFEMIANAETTGVFQFESAGMRRYLRELKPTEFEDLVAMNALYRPGPMIYIPDYIAGKHNPKKVKYVDKILEPLLKKTYGIAVYQEQVLKIAQIIAGFSLGEADILRKAIGKKIASTLAKQRTKFIEGAEKQGYDKKLAVKIFDEVIVPFSGYGFNRSHSVCYARIAYETAYLRANYPVEFMAAMMTTDRSNTDRIVLEMNECSQMEIEVLPPSVNESGSYFTVIPNKKDQDQTQIADKNKDENQDIKNSKIRFGLSAIKGLGEDTVDQIIYERKQNGGFKSLTDFAKRIPTKLINKKTLEALAFSGAFDNFGNRRAVVDSLDDLSRYAKEQQDQKEAGQMGLFGGADESAIAFTLKDSVATKKDILAWERESMGLFVSDHPLKGLDVYFQKYGTPIGHLSEEDAEKKRTIHGLVINTKKIVTKKGKLMAILELEDPTGKIEIAIFPQTFEKINSKAIEKDAFVRVRGKVDERNGQLNCIADEIKVGDLEVVQKKISAGEIFIEKEDGQKTDSKKSKTDVVDKKSDNPFVIKIPRGTTKQTIDALKQCLSVHKAVGSDGVKTVVEIEEKVVVLPFAISLTPELEQEIKQILSV